VVSTGDELVGIAENPLPHQIRRSYPGFVAGPKSLSHLTDELWPLRLGLMLASINAGFDAVWCERAVSRAAPTPDLLRELEVVDFHNSAPWKPMVWAKNAGPVVFGLPAAGVHTALPRYVILAACSQPTGWKKQQRHI
jgi:molybdopterin molybdotransferase